MTYDVISGSVSLIENAHAIVDVSDTRIYGFHSVYLLGKTRGTSPIPGVVKLVTVPLALNLPNSVNLWKLHRRWLRRMRFNYKEWPMVLSSFGSNIRNVINCHQRCATFRPFF